MAGGPGAAIVSSTATRRTLAYLPAAGIVAFALLYALAALLYPGGSYDDPRAVGFSLVENYFCDLLRPVAHGGRANPGYPVALLAMGLVVVTLALFWHVVVRHYPSERSLVTLTRVTGSVSSAATLLLFSPLHDRAIEIGVAFGLVAFFAALAGLMRSGHRWLVAGGAAAALVSAICFVIWRTGVGVAALAALQKLAFVMFLGWVFATSLKVPARSRSP